MARANKQPNTVLPETGGLAPVMGTHAPTKAKKISSARAETKQVKAVVIEEKSLSNQELVDKGSRARVGGATSKKVDAARRSPKPAPLQTGQWITVASIARTKKIVAALARRDEGCLE